MCVHLSVPAPRAPCLGGAQAWSSLAQRCVPGLFWPRLPARSPRGTHTSKVPFLRSTPVWASANSYFGGNGILLGLPTPCRSPRSVVFCTTPRLELGRPAIPTAVPTKALWSIRGLVALSPSSYCCPGPAPPSLLQGSRLPAGPKHPDPAAAPGRVFPQLPPPGLAAPRPAAPNSRPGPSVASRQHSSRTLLRSQLGRPLGTPHAPPPRQRAPGQSSV